MKRLPYCLALILIGCKTVGTNSSTPQGFILTSSRWNISPINVCWQDMNPAFALQRAWVENRVRAEYESFTSLRFQGWGACQGNSRGIRIATGDVWPHTKGLGNTLDGEQSGMALSFTFQNLVDENGQPAFVDCRPGSTQGWGNQNCIEIIAIHEFGHAVGLAHEQNRTDTPSTCKKKPQGPDGDVSTGPWDADSAMNYCNRVWSNNGRLSAGDIQALGTLYAAPATPEDEYMAVDFNGDKKTNIAVRRGMHILFDYNFDGNHDGSQMYGNGNSEDQYLVGDWNGDGRDNLAVRRGATIYMDINFDGRHDLEFTFGNGNAEDQYLVGDWDGDGKDNIAVRRGSQILMDTNFDGAHEKSQAFGDGNSESQYLVGDWDGDGKDNIAVRRGSSILMDYNFDGAADFTQIFGDGPSESQYFVGDWDGDGRDNIAIRRGSKILMDTNFDGRHDIEQIYGNGK